MGHGREIAEDRSPGLLVEPGPIESGPELPYRIVWPSACALATTSVPTDAGPAAVVDDDLLAQRIARVLRDRPADDIDRSAGRNGTTMRIGRLR